MLSSFSSLIASCVEHWNMWERISCESVVEWVLGLIMYGVWWKVELGVLATVCDRCQSEAQGQLSPHIGVEVEL